jgi:DNA-binding IclR family transcriptional regulator
MSSISGSGARILAILDLFIEERPEWTPDRMMAQLGYSRPTLYRYLKTLKDAGFLVSLPQAGYTLGPRVTELDFLMQRADPLIRAGAPYLARLARDYPCSAFLVRWYGRRILCVASEVSAPHPKSSYPRGRPMPMGRGAISRAIIANLPRREREALVAEFLPEFRAVGQGDSVAEVLGKLAEARRDGVVVAHGEVTPGVIGVAAPVMAADRMPIAALCLTSDEREAGAARLAVIRDKVRDYAATMSADLSKSVTPGATAFA